MDVRYMNRTPSTAATWRKEKRFCKDPFDSPPLFANESTGMEKDESNIRCNQLTDGNDWTSPKKLLIHSHFDEIPQNVKNVRTHDDNCCCRVATIFLLMYVQYDVTCQEARGHKNKREGADFHLHFGANSVEIESELDES